MIGQILKHYICRPPSATQLYIHICGPLSPDNLRESQVAIYFVYRENEMYKGQIDVLRIHSSVFPL
jgi:hypothetical protein